MNTSVYKIKDLWSIVLLPIVILFGGGILFFLQEIVPATIVCAVSFAISIFEIICRKQLFARITISEKSVMIFYKREILKEIKWTEIKDAMINLYMPEGGLLISTKQYDINAKPGKEFIEKNNHGIVLNFSQKYIFDELCKYFYNIPVKIKNFDKLPLEIQNTLKKTVDTKKTTRT